MERKQDEKKKVVWLQEMLRLPLRIVLKFRLSRMADHRNLQDGGVEMLSGNLLAQGKRLLTVLLVLPLLAGTVRAQVTATITGSVKDTSGAVVPGTAITAKNLETGLTRTAETDESGNYRFTALPVGPHEMNAETGKFICVSKKSSTLVLKRMTELVAD